MTEHLTKSDVADIAAYVKIAMTPDEIARMTVDLNNIIDTLEPIRQYDLEGVEPTFHPIGALVNVMCEDSPAPSFSQQEALANAPKQQDGAFLIPSILGDGGDK